MWRKGNVRPVISAAPIASASTKRCYVTAAMIVAISATKANAVRIACIQLTIDLIPCWINSIKFNSISNRFNLSLIQSHSMQYKIDSIKFIPIWNWCNQIQFNIKLIQSSSILYRFNSIQYKINSTNSIQF